MKRIGYALGAAIWVAALVMAPAAMATQDTPKTLKPANLSGLRDFDFLNGHWKTKHRRLKQRFVGSGEWIEFDGSFSQRPLMDGWANTGDNVFDMPGGTYRGVSLRAYDPQTGQWTVWWLDGRNPGDDLSPPNKGRFEGGLGRFFAKDTMQGKPVLVRVTWSQPSPDAPRWEQAFSIDDGKTWELNWVTDFIRVDAKTAAAD